MRNYRFSGTLDREDSQVGKAYSKFSRTRHIRYNRSGPYLLTGFLTAQKIGTPNPQIVQGPTIIEKKRKKKKKYIYIALTVPGSQLLPFIMLVCRPRTNLIFSPANPRTRHLLTWNQAVVMVEGSSISMLSTNMDKGTAV